MSLYICIGVYKFDKKINKKIKTVRRLTIFTSLFLCYVLSYLT